MLKNHDNKKCKFDRIMRDRELNQEEKQRRVMVKLVHQLQPPR